MLLQKAEAAYDASFERLKQAVARSKAHPGKPHADFQRVHRAYLTTDEKCSEAELSESKAEADWLRACLAERDAEIDLLMLQWGHSNQQLDSAVSTASAALSSAKTLKKIADFRCSNLGSTVESEDDT